MDESMSEQSDSKGDSTSDGLHFSYSSSSLSEESGESESGFGSPYSGGSTVEPCLYKPERGSEDSSYSSSEDEERLHNLNWLVLYGIWDR